MTEECSKSRFPVKQAAAVSGLFFIAQFALRIVNPFLVFMVHDFFPELPASAIGYKVGYLTSSYYLGQVAGSIMWGRLADKFGRRPAVFASVIGCLLCCLLFGFSASYAWAIVSRTLLGFLNGIAVICKSMLFELMDDQQKARGFSLLGITANSAKLTAPIIGGFLSCPAARFSILNTSFFVKFAYCIPSLITVALGVAILIGVFRVLKETKVTKIDKPETTSINLPCNSFNCNDDEFKHKGESYGSPAQLFDTKTMDVLAKSEVYNRQAIHSSSDKSKKKKSALNTKKAVWKQLYDRQVIMIISMYGWLCFMATTFEQCVPLLLVVSPEQGGLMFSSSDLALFMIVNAVIALLYQAFLYPYIISKLGILRSFQVFLVGAAVFASCIPFVSSLEPVQPSIAETKPNSLQCRDNITCYNNTGSTETDIADMNLYINGTVDSATRNPYENIGQCEFQVEDKEKNKQSVSIHVWIILACVVSIVALCNTTVTLNVIILCQDSAEPSTLGTVNGVAHTLASIGRCAGPSVGANLFAWSQENGLSWPLDYHLMFHIMSISCLGILFVSMCLPRTTETRREVIRTSSLLLTDENILVQRETVV